MSQMHVPALQEKVGLRNVPGTYMVLEVDGLSEVADLVCLEDGQWPHMELGVPFFDILQLDEGGTRHACRLH
jgi:hypothetical protein